MPDQPDPQPNRLEQAFDRVAAGDWFGAGLLAAKHAKNEFSKPTPTPTSARLYVGNLDFDVSDDDLQQLFSGFGGVQSAEVARHSHTKRSKGFAFVTMQTLEQAIAAWQELDGGIWMKRKLVVSGAKQEKTID